VFHPAIVLPGWPSNVNSDYEVSLTYDTFQKENESRSNRRNELCGFEPHSW